MIRKILLLIYYSFARYYPDKPFPGYRLGNWLRSAIGRKVFLSAGRKIWIKHGARFDNGRYIRIGNYSQLGIDCRVDNDLVLGDHVLMGPEVAIYSQTHEFKDVEIPVMNQGAKERRPVVIGDDVWIGIRTVILPGVTIGNHVIIGACSLVTHDIPDYAIVGGIPARVLRYRVDTLDDSNKELCETCHIGDAL